MPVIKNHKPDREFELTQLIHALEQLVETLERDPICQWTRGFKSNLDNALHLKNYGFTQQDLSDLSSSVRQPFGGMGSFNDYYPLDDGKIAPWAQECYERSASVYEFADALRITGTIG